ncbi:DoxX family protein [Burkholderia sp. BCC1999]|uniref:DoxX family protein n=1 Tax=Burkholderia sp. BCC1999 TaxID=2817448 RepID=UPI002AC34350|nr:DoxX family protein [Burkholderia sp. BCC1999]
MSSESIIREGKRPNSVLSISLWVAQWLIFVAFVVFGGMKLFMPIDHLAAMWGWPGQVPPAFLRFMGLIDAAGGIGVLLPALTRIRPRLTVWAALGCVVLQISAIVFHVSRGEAVVTPLNLALLALCAFILWGRTRKAPIASRY